MFISINKDLFSKDKDGDSIVDEINTSLRFFEEKMNEKQIPSIKKKLDVESIDINGNIKLNYSKRIGNQVVIFFEVGQSITNLSVDKRFAPRSRIISRTFHELNWYATITIDTDGRIELSEDALKSGTWVYLTYIIAKEV